MEYVVAISGMRDTPGTCRWCPFRVEGDMSGPDYCRAMVATGRSAFDAYPDINHCPLRKIPVKK